MKKFKLRLKRGFYKILVKYNLKKLNKFYYEPFVYVYSDGRTCLDGMTSTVRFLEKFNVGALIEEDADKEAWKIVNEKYPDWKGYVRFF